MTELTNKEVLEMWQNYTFRGKNVSTYNTINNYLRGIIDYSYNNVFKNIFKLKTDKDVLEFFDYYIGKMNKIIDKHKTEKELILYRGECRNFFNNVVGDIIKFDNFHSTSKSINIAYGFTTNIYSHCKNILFILLLPKKSSYLELDSEVVNCNKDDNVCTHVNEQEILLPSGSSYIIVDKRTIRNGVLVIKLRKIVNNTIVNKNFNDPKYDVFLKLINKYVKNVKALDKYNNYSSETYELLSDYNMNDILSKKDNISKILKISKQKIELKTKFEKIKSLGFIYYGYELNYPDKYHERIKLLEKIPKTKFKTIKNIILYAGYSSLDKYLKPHDFVSILSKSAQNIFTYNKIIKTSTTKDKFIYNDVYDYDYPAMKFKKITKDTKKDQFHLHYYQHVIKFLCKNIKICTNDKHFYDYQNEILMIPNYSCRVVKKEETENKFGLKYFMYTIQVSGVT